MQIISETDSHVVVQDKSASGVAFEIGYPKSEGYQKATLQTEMSDLAATPSGYEALLWVPGQHGYISPGAEKLGIMNGYVSHDRGPVYSYRINFYNSRGWGFTFIDETNDTYYCSTVRNGWHYIDYNSDKGTIVGVK